MKDQNATKHSEIRNAKLTEKLEDKHENTSVDRGKRQNWEVGKIKKMYGLVLANT